MRCRGPRFLFAFSRRAIEVPPSLTSISSPQTHAAVGGVRLEHGLWLHPGQRAGGGAAGLRQHLEDNMKAKVYWFFNTRRPRRGQKSFSSVGIMIVLHLNGDNTCIDCQKGLGGLLNNRIDTFAEDRFLFFCFLESWNKRLIETRELHSESTQLANGDNRSSFLLFDRISYRVVY